MTEGKSPAWLRIWNTFIRGLHPIVWNGSTHLAMLIHDTNMVGSTIAKGRNNKLPRLDGGLSDEELSILDKAGFGEKAMNGS